MQHYRPRIYDAHLTQPELLRLRHSLYPSATSTTVKQPILISGSPLRCQDGNKRVTLLAANAFLELNGHAIQRVPLAPDPNDDGIAEAHVKVATESWSATELAEYYERIATPATGTDVAQYYDGAELY